MTISIDYELYTISYKYNSPRVKHMVKFKNYKKTSYLQVKYC